jgi:hypothetical protein
MPDQSQDSIEVCSFCGVLVGEPFEDSFRFIDFQRHELGCPHTPGISEDEVMFYMGIGPYDRVKPPQPAHKTRFERILHSDYP